MEYVDLAFGRAHIDAPLQLVHYHAVQGHREDHADEQDTAHQVVYLAAAIQGDGVQVRTRSPHPSVDVCDGQAVIIEAVQRFIAVLTIAGVQRCTGGSEIPDQNSTIFAGADEVLSTVGESQACDGLVMLRDGVQHATRVQVPEVDVLLNAGHQERCIRRDGHGVDLARHHEANARHLLLLVDGPDMDQGLGGVRRKQIVQADDGEALVLGASPTLVAHQVCASAQILDAAGSVVLAARADEHGLHNVGHFARILQFTHVLSK